jgi:hypothetical protein
VAGEIFEISHELYAPEIENFQEPINMGVNEYITVEPSKGWLLYLEATWDL